MLNFLQRTAEKAQAGAGRVWRSVRHLNPRLVFAIASVLFITPQIVEASTASTVMMFLARILQGIVGFFGALLVSLVNVLIDVAQYNDFVTAKAVGIGWVLVRDITNMFFVLVLLLVAFGTIIGHEKWNYKNKTVNKLIVAAIIVNFSRTIVGLMIDFSQVVMLTFVVGFKEVAGGNFANAFRINKMLEAGASDSETKPDEAAEALKIVAAYLLAVVMLAISTAVIIYMIVALVVRMVYLWLLTVLSPMAFFLRVVPGQSGKFDKWWGMLMTQLTFGPVMAFFLWLSLAAVAAEPNLGVAGGATGTSSANPADAGAPSAAFASDELQSFIIAVALLMGGVKMAEEMAGDTGKIAKSIVGQAKKRATQAASFAGKGALAAGGLALSGAGKIPLALGKELRDADGKVIGRERVQLKALAGVKYDSAKKSLKGTFGMDKDANEKKAELEKIKALEGTGKGAEAERLRQNRYSKNLKKLNEDGVTGEALKKAYEEEKKKSPDSEKSKMLALALAGEGGFNGKSGEIAKIAGNDATLKKMMSSAAKKSGDMFADVDMTKPEEAAEKIADQYSQLGKGEKAKFARAAADGVMNGPDGKPKNPAAMEAIKAVSEQDFREFPNELKKKVLESLKLAVQNGHMSPEDAVKKSTELDAEGKTAIRTDSEIAVAQEKKLAKERGLLLGVGAVDSAFGGISEESGNFENANQIKAYAGYAAMDKKNARAAAAAVAPALMTEGGGVNDLAMGAMSNLDSDGVIAMARDPKVSRDAVFATIQAATGIAAMSTADIAAKQAEMTGKGMDEGEALKLIEDAKRNAEEIVSQYSASGSTLRSATRNITFKMDVARFAGQAGSDFVSATVVPVAAAAGTVASGGMAGAAAAAGTMFIKSDTGQAVSGAVAKYAKEALKGSTASIKQDLGDAVRSVKRFSRGSTRGRMKL